MTTFEFDVAHDGFNDFLRDAEEADLTVEVVTMDGPGGGNPLCRITDVEGLVIRFMIKHYDPDFAADAARYMV